MKKIVLVSIAVASLMYAHDVATELEHAIKTAPSLESPSQDMSKMKIMGKCGADQKMKKPMMHQHDENVSTMELDLEHAIKTPPSEESPREDMSKMKAMGKCGADQKTKMHQHKDENASAVELELEHAIKTAPSVESPKEDMSRMKSMGKCGSHK